MLTDDEEREGQRKAVTASDVRQLYFRDSAKPPCVAPNVG